MLTTNTPTERTDHPFDLEVTYGGDRSTAEIFPSYLNPRATAVIKITAPDGKVTETKMTFDKNRFFADFKTPVTGKYHVEVVYSYGSHSFSAVSDFNVSYYPEYDAFAVRDVTSVHRFMKNAGTVYTDTAVDLSLNKNRVATYEYSFKIPLLILAVALFVADVFIRKVRWSEIKHFFRRRSTKKIKEKGESQA